jgi:glycosyltransferase involved in cell wall biosynthesis
MECRADLHVHSRYSDTPSEWILRRVGSPECFSEPEEVYRSCRAQGMQLVTITDHDTIEGALAIAHLPGTFVSCEVTAAFPEDGCEIHLLVYGIDETRHREIQALRGNLYELRDYLLAERIPCSVAHALFRADERFGLGHFERLLVLFKTFEGLNGARHPRAGMVVRAVLANLSPGLVADLASHHGLDPRDPEPWRKHLTAGSDDHGGLYAASAWTETPEAADAAAYLDHLREGRARIAGETGSSLRLGRSLQQLGRLYLRRRAAGGGSGLLDELVRRLVAGEPPGAGDRLRIFTSGLRGSNRQDPSLRALHAALGGLPWQLPVGQSPDRRSFALSSALGHRLVWEAVAEAGRSATRGQLAEAPQALGLLPAAALCLAPYAAAFHTQHRDEDLVRAVAARFPAATLLRSRGDCRAWFTDVADEQAPAVQPLLAFADRLGRRPEALTVLTCGEPLPSGLPGRSFHPVGEMAPPEAGGQALRLPPVLEVVEHCERLGVEEVVIATPGPMGLAGWLTAWVLGLRLTVVQQLDLTAWLRRSSGSTLLEQLAAGWQRLLWTRADSVLVPDQRTAATVAAEGIAPDRIRLLPRAVDRRRFGPERCQPAFWRRRGLGVGCKILHVGPLTQRGPAEVLLEAFHRLAGEGHAAQLVIAGGGPALAELARRHRHPAILFTGPLAGDELARAYASADLYVDLASADLRGHRLFEALASGLPAVTDARAGAADLVHAHAAGLVLDTGRPEALLDALRLMVLDSPRRSAAARAAVQLARSLPGWDEAIGALWSEAPVRATPAVAAEIVASAPRGAAGSAGPPEEKAARRASG